MKNLSMLATGAMLCAAAAAQAAPATYVIDPLHTSAIFEINHFDTSTNRGRFTKTEGTVEVDKAAKTGKVDLTVQLASLQTVSSVFTKEILGKEMMNAAKFPKAHFVGSKFTFVGDKVSEIAGTLTFMGETKPVVLKAQNFNCYENPMTKREVCGGDFDTTLVRSQYGLNYGLEWGMPDNVHMVIQVEGIKK